MECVIEAHGVFWREKMLLMHLQCVSVVTNVVVVVVMLSQSHITLVSK